MKRILKLIAPKIGKAAKRVALPVIKEDGENALKRIAAGENVKKVTKETAKSSLRGIKRKAADEVVNVMNKDVLNDVKNQATEELVRYFPSSAKPLLRNANESMYLIPPGNQSPLPPPSLSPLELFTDSMEAVTIVSDEFAMTCTFLRLRFDIM
eukprot:gene2766-3200_t